MKTPEERQAAWLEHWAAREPTDGVGEEMLDIDMRDSVKLLTAPRDVWIEDAGLVVRTAAHVAAAFCVTESTVGYWLRKGCPGRPGHYDLGRVIRWVMTHIGKPQNGGYE